MAVIAVQRGTAPEFVGVGTSTTASPLPGVTTAGNTLLIVAQIYGKGGTSANAAHLTTVTDSQGNAYAVQHGSSVGAQTPTSSPNYYNNVDIAVRHRNRRRHQSDDHVQLLAVNAFAVWTACGVDAQSIRRGSARHRLPRRRRPALVHSRRALMGRCLVAAFNEDGTNLDSWVATAGWTLTATAMPDRVRRPMSPLAQTTAAAVTPAMTSASGQGAAALISFVSGTTLVAITASATAVAAASATVTAPCAITASAAAVANAQATVTTPRTLTPTAQGVAGAVAVITAAAKLAATATAVAGATAAVTTATVPMLAPRATVISAAAATLRVPQGLQANATAVSHAVAVVTYPGEILAIYVRPHLQTSVSMTMTLVLRSSSAYDLQIKASAERDETVSTH